jgi:hypothetical protein
MIRISQSEKFYIEQHLPNTHIQICSKRKKGRGVDQGKTYYMSESNQAVKMLAELRKQNILKSKDGSN